MVKGNSPRRHHGPPRLPSGRRVYWYRRKGSAHWQATTDDPAWLNISDYDLVVTDGPPPGYMPPPKPEKPFSAAERASERDRRSYRPPRGPTAYQLEKMRRDQQAFEPAAPACNGPEI